MVEPRYRHHCSDCVFLGYHGEHDLYYCDNHTENDWGDSKYSYVRFVRRSVSDEVRYTEQYNSISISCLMESRVYRLGFLKPLYAKASQLAFQKNMLCKCGVDIITNNLGISKISE